MPSSRTISFFLHSPAPGIASPSLHTCSVRSFSCQHGTTRTRPQPRPQYRARFSPASRPSIAFFTSTSVRPREQNFYEVLDLPPTATAAEIKKYAHTTNPPIQKPDPPTFDSNPKSNTHQAILRPLPPPPPRPQPHRPGRLPTLRPYLSSLQHPRQRLQTRNLRPRSRPANPTPPIPIRQPQQPLRKPPQRLRRLPPTIRP